MTIENISPEEKALLLQAKAIADGAKAMDRELDDAERAKASELLNQVETLAKTRRENAAKAAGDQSLLDRITAGLTEDDAKSVNADALKNAGLLTDEAKAKALTSWGAKFVQSAGYVQFLKDYPGGPPEDANVKSVPVGMGGFKDLLTSSDFPGIINPQQLGLIVPPIWGRELTIRDLITVGQTGSDVVEYARLASVTNAAAPVAEAANFTDGAISVATTDTAGGAPYTNVVTTAAASGVKPFSNMAYEKVTTTVKNIAHLMAATRRSLSDAGQLSTLIDNFLRYGLQEEVEDQVISGAGTGENFDGILNVDGTTPQAFSTNKIETIRKAITACKVTGRARPTAVGLHPADDEALDLAKDSQNRYYGNGPFGAGPSTIWGYPRFVTEAIPEGTAIVADWRLAVLWDREQTTVAMTEAHKDWFARNLVALRAELRAAFGVLRPAAFVIADLTA